MTDSTKGGNLVGRAPRRGFIHFAKAWYGSSLLGAGLTIGGRPTVGDGIQLCMMDQDGERDTSLEVLIEWHELEPGRPPAPKLHAYDESWPMLIQLGDVFKQLGEIGHTRPQPADVIALLTTLGFEDLTEREQPRGVPPRPTA